MFHQYFCIVEKENTTEISQSIALLYTNIRRRRAYEDTIIYVWKRMRARNISVYRIPQSLWKLVFDSYNETARVRKYEGGRQNNLHSMRLYSYIAKHYMGGFLNANFRKQNRISWMYIHNCVLSVLYIYNTYMMYKIKKQVRGVPASLENYLYVYIKWNRIRYFVYMVGTDFILYIYLQCVNVHEEHTVKFANAKYTIWYQL